MLTGFGGWSYFEKEKPFVQYFDRCKDIGEKSSDIEKKLPQIEKYYQELVIEEGDFNLFKPTLKDLFDNWKRNN